MSEIKAEGKRSLIYWIRHGETPGNYGRFYMDPLKGFLTDRGVLQAMAAGQALADVPFTRVYSSHLPRATATAKIILEQSKYSSTLEVHIDPRIREKDHMEMTGKSHVEGNALRGEGLDEAHPLYPYWHFYIKGTEEIMDILKRAESFFRDLLEDLSKSTVEETVLIIGHGYFTNLWMTHLELEQEKYMLTNYSKELTLPLRNCGYHKFLMGLQFSDDAENAGESSSDPVFAWEFLEIHRDEHLASTGFAPVRRQIAVPGMKM